MASNKLVQKQLRTLIPSMSEKDLRRVFEAFRETIGDSIQYMCKEISYKCYEGTLSIRGKKASGYGRNDQEAYTHAIKNLLEMLVEEDDLLFVLRHCIKKTSEPAEESNKENVARKSLTIKPSFSASISIGEVTEGRKSKAHLKPSHIQSLNISLHRPNNKSEVELELEGAKMYISQLELKLKSLEEENMYLKSKVHAQTAEPSLCTFASTAHPPAFHNSSDHDFQGRMSFEPKHTQSHYSQHEKIAEKLSSSVQDLHKNCQNAKPDPRTKAPMSIPKLKLEILPSFHGKSTKSINHSFLANQQAAGK